MVKSPIVSLLNAHIYKQLNPHLWNMEPDQYTPLYPYVPHDISKVLSHYIPLYPTLFHYISLYRTISHYIPW